MGDHAVPGGEHIGQAGAHRGVDRDRALDAQRGPGLGRQRGVRADADYHQDQVGCSGHGGAVGRGGVDLQPPGLGCLSPG